MKKEYFKLYCVDHRNGKLIGFSVYKTREHAEKVGKMLFLKSYKIEKV